MKTSKFILISVSLAIAGCGSDMPIKRINKNTNEYVLNRDDKTPLGNLPDLKKRVQTDAENHCASQGMAFAERYSIDKERAILVWPETTLYFECATRNK